MIIWCLKLFKSPYQPTLLTSADLLNDFARCHTASLSPAHEDGCQRLDERYSISNHVTPDSYNRFAPIRVQRVCDTVRYRDESSQSKDFTLRSSYEKASKRPSSETDSLTALFEVYSSSLTQPAFINTNTVAVLKRRRSPDSFFPCCFSCYTLLGIALLKPNNYFRFIRRKRWIMTLGTLEICSSA